MAGSRSRSRSPDFHIYNVSPPQKPEPLISSGKLRKPAGNLEAAAKIDNEQSSADEGDIFSMDISPVTENPFVLPASVPQMMPQKSLTPREPSAASARSVSPLTGQGRPYCGFYFTPTNRSTLSQSAPTNSVNVLGRGETEDDSFRYPLAESPGLNR